MVVVFVALRLGVVLLVHFGGVCWSKMKKGLCIGVFLLIWISSSSSLVCQITPGQDCRKVNEVGNLPISHFLCGDLIPAYHDHLCWQKMVKRQAPEDILLGRRSANRFLSAHHRTKRSFNIVEECCNEGCNLEEVQEYCPPS